MAKFALPSTQPDGRDAEKGEKRVLQSRDMLRDVVKNEQKCTGLNEDVLLTSGGAAANRLLAGCCELRGGEKEKSEEASKKSRVFIPMRHPSSI
jgi:hypothetical protein